jgi:MFS family permease
MLSILWYSACNFIAGFSPTFTFLFVVRALLGVGMGALGRRAFRPPWKNLLRYRTPIVCLRQAVAAVVGCRIIAATEVPQKPAATPGDRNPGLASAFFTRAAVVGAAMCSAC